jgi:hypothetical protein
MLIDKLAVEVVTKTGAGTQTVMGKFEKSQTKLNYLIGN